MALFERSQVDTLRRRLQEEPAFINAIFGPRQTGKTTIVRQALAQIDLDSRYLAVDAPDADRPSGYSTETLAPLPEPWNRGTDWLVRHWEKARLEADRAAQGYVLVLDEIQRIPQWSSIVKGLWDADRAKNRSLRVVILGSTPMLMQKGLSESLAGRFELIPVTHWSFPEMAEAFGYGLDEFLFFGGYPGTARLIREPRRWRDYIQNSIIEPMLEWDTPAMGRIDKPAPLRNLFELGTKNSGQFLSCSKMQGQLQDAGSATTLARYLDLLSKIGLLTGLQKYANVPSRQKASSPKLNVHNTGLMAAGSRIDSLPEAKENSQFWGRLVESAVGAHLLNTAESDMQVYYWRDASCEVDFVLRCRSRIVSFKVKNGAKPQSLQGLAEFKRRFRPYRSWLVGTGGVPLSEFLSKPADHWFK